MKAINSQKEVSTKLTKGLLDLIILQFVSTQPMHGYQIITKDPQKLRRILRSKHSLPLAKHLEKKGFVKSEWNMNSERPRKVYSLTSNGQNMLVFTEDSLNLICRKISHKQTHDVTLGAIYPVSSNFDG